VVFQSTIHQSVPERCASSLFGGELTSVEHSSTARFAALEELIGEQDNAGSLSMLQNFTRRWNDLRASLGQVKLTDRMVLEALRQEVIRVAFLEITGFENPAFTDAMIEAKTAWKSIRADCGRICTGSR
jgi:hypothetical protein